GSGAVRGARGGAGGAGEIVGVRPVDPEAAITERRKVNGCGCGPAEDDIRGTGAAPAVVARSAGANEEVGAAVAVHVAGGSDRGGRRIVSHRAPATPPPPPERPPGALALRRPLRA